MTGTCDGFQRGISYLRISVTDRCNLRCIYCMPPEGVELVSHDDILSFEEILLAVRAAVALGIDKIRITGGEPLVRSGVVELVSMIAAVEGVKDISMTTNGILMDKYADRLVGAGLNRVNISLDTLKYERFTKITRTGTLADALKGLQAARAAGLTPVKINMVPMRGINDDEVIDFAQMTVTSGWHVRFIELMPLNRQAGFVPSHILQRQIAQLGPLEPFFGLTGNGAARYFTLPGATGTIGFISPVSEPFCEGCNRLRLSAAGMVYPCLFSTDGIDIRTPLRKGADVDAVKKLLAAAIAAKPKKHLLSEGGTVDTKMSSIGG
ncbi:MAG: GTP 3',8-cyclase MoaA [Chloroflexi bacterium]|nr:GTP 3',8-cyclase MoaA [Chloroflexota bacterium]